jgi:hypothetical protein
MNVDHIAPDDYTFGATPQPDPQSPPTTPKSRAEKAGFVNDADLRRWCVDKVVASHACHALATEVVHLYDFMIAAE